MLNCLYWNVKQMVNKFFWKTALSLQYHPTYISGHHLFSVWRDSIHHITNLTCALFVLKTWLYGFVMLRTAAFRKVHSSRRCFRNFFQFIVLTLYLRSITIHIYMTLCMFVHDRSMPDVSRNEDYVDHEDPCGNSSGSWELVCSQC